MSKRNGKNALALPTQLRPFDPDHEATVHVIIETPKGSRNKYAFDPGQRVFKLKRVLPAGMTFPYDFGFVPSTKAEDGDPVDVLVLMDEPAFPGCLLESRLIGVIEGEQQEKGEKERNDRVVAIALSNHSFADIEHVDDLGKQFLRELEMFFVNYHDLQGEKYRVLDVRGPSQARKCIEQGLRSKK